MERQGTPDGASSTSNTVHGVVHGSVWQAGNVYGDVHLHHQAAPPPAVPGPPLVDHRPSGLGPEVEVGDVLHLVHDQPGDASSTGDGGAVVRQARCLRLTDRGGFGWLRRVEVRQATPLALRARRALTAEHDLLRRLSGVVPHLPAVLQFAEGPGDTATLVTAWPETRSHRACDPLDVLLLRGPVRDAGVLARVCDALASLCATLGALHAHRTVHGALTPARLIMRDDGALSLRDLARTDQEPPEYPAPEQLARGVAGPWTDVHQVGAIAYHLVTGRQPSPRAPLPVRAWAPEVPEDLADTIDSALVPECAERPDTATLGARLRALAHPTR
ncbi:hypothetical protein ACFFQW_16575 [Umezawaea endophytica]|uniref:Protein kinase domain-containing protein n=1 Tax=Umezawaea endophytica TaxID=1654476 RepID=A0A9X2VP92_9PSEU|nr:hypothetical protein [Umezawaea endophytica]MCS7480366.1 hypothetical protein [Umezawaea endophytica]